MILSAGQTRKEVRMDAVPCVGYSLIQGGRFFCPADVQGANSLCCCIHVSCFAIAELSWELVYKTEC